MFGLCMRAQVHAGYRDEIWQLSDHAIWPKITAKLAKCNRALPSPLAMSAHMRANCFCTQTVLIEKTHFLLYHGICLRLDMCWPFAGRRHVQLAGNSEIRVR